MRRALIAFVLTAAVNLAPTTYAQTAQAPANPGCVSDSSQHIVRFPFGGNTSPSLCLEIEQRPQRFLVPNGQSDTAQQLQAKTSTVATTRQTDRGSEVTANVPSTATLQVLELATRQLKDLLTGFNAISLPPDFRVALSKTSQAAINAQQLSADKNMQGDDPPRRIVALASATNGRVIDLLQQSSAFIFSTTDRPMILITIGNLAASRRRTSDQAAAELTSRLCSAQFMISDLERCYFQVALARNAKGELVVAAQQTSSGTQIFDTLVSDASQVVNVNGVDLLPNDAPFTYESSQTVTINYYHLPNGCRAYPSDPKDSVTLVLQAAPQVINEAKWLNGISVDTPKIYDTATLRQMLLESETQLKAIQGFSGQSIFGAIGSFQGVSRDTSYFSAQATTTPTSGLSTTATSGSATNNSSQIVAPISGGGTITVTCPVGMIPGSVGATTTCVASAGAPSSSASVTTIPAGTNTQTSGGNTSSSLASTVTTPQISASVPTAISTPGFSAPTSTSLSPEDLLDKQVQLNSQIEMYRLLMRGAESDKYMTSDTRAVGLREQTTVGFTVSLTPPKQYPHAVAEVRVILVPRVGHRPPSIMTLLPEEKSYNVAKLTSHADAFGAGVAIAPVSLGVNTGRAKDRSYIARDTDTEAELLPRPPGNNNPMDADQGVWEPWWQRAGYHIKGKLRDNRMTDGCPPFAGNTRDAIAFGWQFHPVFGEAYVRGGNRQVFAQLALPNDDTDNSQPLIYVQTLWREYDNKNRVMGATYVNSCSVINTPTDIVVRNQPHIRKLTVGDIGNGQVRLRAEGDFFATGISVRSATQTIAPVAFDGATIETFGDIHDLIRAGDMTMLTSNGHRQAFAVQTNPKKNVCTVALIEETALPKPDGNSEVHLRLQLGDGFDLSSTEDGQPTPFVMIGSSVFGTLEQPFDNPEKDHCTKAAAPGSKIQCDYDFIAPTASLRTSKQLVLSDLTRENFRVQGALKFAPTFTAISLNDEDKKASTKLFDVVATDLSNATFLCAAVQAGMGNFCVQPVLRAATLPLGAVAPAPDSITIANPTLAQLALKETTLGAAKKVSFDVYGRTPTQRTRWTLSLAEPEKPKLVATPEIVRRNDSVPITLKGLDFSDATGVVFEGATIATFPQSKDKDTRKFTIPLSVTKLTGTKTFTLQFSGKTPEQTFSIDVVQR